MMDTIEVFVIDNSSLFCDGLRNADSQAEDIKLVGASEISDETIELVEAYNPNIIMLDIGLPSLVGLNLARQIKRILPATSLLVLTSYHDDGHLFQAIKSGASGYLLKETKPDELLLAIRKIHQGEYILIDSVMSRPTVMENILRQFQDFALNGVAMEKLVSPLSPRELEILGHKAHGLLSKQVAHMLGISEQTIKNHMASILRKLEVNDRTQAVVMAMRHGWINLSVAEPPEKKNKIRD
jgi:DNA-binding NarL/FixJ family response regulator